MNFLNLRTCSAASAFYDFFKKLNDKTHTQPPKNTGTHHDYPLKYKGKGQINKKRPHPSTVIF